MFKVLSIIENERIDPRLLQKIGEKLSQTIDDINCNPYQSERASLSRHYQNSISTPADLSDSSFEADDRHYWDKDQFWKRYRDYRDNHPQKEDLHE